MLEGKVCLQSCTPLSSKLFTNPSVERTVFLGLALAAFFVVVAGTEEAFADSAPVLQHTAPGQNAHYREMSESLSVASTFDWPSPPRAFTRGISDGLSVSTGFNTPAQQAQTYGPVQQRTNSSPTPVAMQRTDERLTFRTIGKLASSNADGTPYNSLISAFSGQQQAQTDEQVDQALQEILNASGDGADPDSNSRLLSQLEMYSAYVASEKSIQNAVLINAGTSAVLLGGALFVVVARQPAVSDGRAHRRMLALFMLKHQLDAVPKSGGAPVTYALLVVLAVFAASSMAVAVGPSSAQEYADAPAGARIELSSAYHLDSGRTALGDVYEQSKKLDGVWTDEISDGQYVRATFEQDLTSSRDITVFARVVSGTPRIEVYEAGGNDLIAEFVTLASNRYSKVLLTNLQSSQDTFDLRVVGGSVEFDYIVDPSPVPTFVAAGGSAASGSGISPALPAGIQENDILLLFVETADQAVSISNANGGTWTEVTNSPQGADGGSLATSTRLTVFWSRYNGSQGAPTTTDSGNHQVGVILAFRGVDTTGDPWDVTSGGVETTSDTSGSIPGTTTTVVNTLVVTAIAISLDASSTTNFSGWSNANLSSITERFDFASNVQNGGGLGIATGEKATAGAYGATSVTLGSSASKGMMTMALRPPPPGPPTLSISEPDGTGDTISRNETYAITYTLSDPDDDVTVAFYYDTNNSGFDGTAISGACATAPEGTNVTCDWDTTGLVVGTYYVYGIADDGVNPAVSAYSPGAITIDRAPTFVAAGTAASASGAITPALPSGLEANDILLLFVETADQAVSLSDQNGGTWTEVTNSPQGADGGSLATSTRLTVFWSRYNGIQGDPTVANSGNHNLGVILAFRGVAETGDPWDVTSGNSESTSDTSLAATGATTTTANTLVVIAAALMDDAQDFGAAWTNANLSNIKVRANEGTAAGNDGRLGVVTGKKATPGTYGDTTNTLTASSVKGMMTIALKPLPSLRSTSDSMSVSDSILAKLAGKAVADSLSVSDSTTAKVTGKAVGESFGVSDSINAQTTVIPDTNIAAIAYRSDTGVDGTSSPKYREWNPATKTWGSEVELESAGSPIRNAWLEWSPVSTKRVIMVLSEDGTLDSYACDNDCETPGNWTVTHDVADLWNTEPAATWRPFDIEYEKTSGDLVLVYDRVSPGSNTADLFYRIMPDSSHTFGDEFSFNDTGSIIPENVYSFVRMDSRRTTGSNDLGLVALSVTNQRAIAFYWNGTTDTFGDFKELTSAVSSTDYESVGVAFETTTGDVVAVAGEGVNVMYSQFTSGSWSSVAKVEEVGVDDLDVGTVRWIRFVGNDNSGTQGAFLAVSGFNGFTIHGLDSAYWDGSGWRVYNLGTRHDAAIDSTETRAFDFAWDNAGDALRGILVWGTTSGVISYKRFSAPIAWTGTNTFSDDGTHPWIGLNEKSNPTSSDIVSWLGSAMDDGADLSPIVWYGSSSAVSSLGDDAFTATGNSASESFRTDFRRSSMVKKFPSDTLAVTDTLLARLSAKVIDTTITFDESMIGEKGAPAESSAAAAVYRSNTGTATLNSPKYREWDPATQTWSAEVELANTGSPVRDAKVRFSPETSMRIVVSQSADGTLNLYKCDSGCTSASNWELVAADFADTGAVDVNKYYRAYDVLFSTQSETAMIVYDKEGTDDSEFWYRTYDGTTLSAETGVNLGGTSDDEEIRYLRLAANPTSEEMAVVVMNNNNLTSYGLIWDGSSWGNQQTLATGLNSDNRDGESIGIAYEKSGAALAVSANGQNSMKYTRWNGSSWSTSTHTDPNSQSIANFVKFVTVKPDPAPASTKVMVCQSDNLSLLSCSLFDAGAPGAWNEITTDVGTTSGRPYDFAFHPSGASGVLVSSSGASGTLDYRTFDGTDFESLFTVAAAGTHRWVYAATAITANDVVNALFVKSNSNFDSGALKFKAKIVSAVGDASLTSDSFVDTYESVHIDFQLSKVRKRVIADAVAIADAITRALARALSDSVGTSDSMSKAANKQISDSLSVSVDLAAVKAFVRSASDSIAIVESPTRRPTKSQADSVNVGDTISTRVTRSIADDLEVTDVVTRPVLRSISDSLDIDDSVDAELAAHIISDSFATADTIDIRITRSLSDSVAIEDDLEGKVTARSVSDSLAVSDDITLHVAKSIADSVQVTDEVSAKVTARVLDDSVSITDAITVKPTRSAADSVDVEDVISMRVSRSLSETLAVIDDATRSTESDLADALAVTDAISTRVSRSVSETLGVSDAITKAVTKNLSDDLLVEDEATGRISAIVISDELSIIDSVTAKVTGRAISDSIGVADTITAKITAVAIFDSLEITDSVVAKITARAISEDLSVTDTVTAKITSAAVADSLTVSDTIAAKITGVAADDTLSVTDTVVAKVTAKSISDSLEVTDTVVARVTAAAISDDLAVTDTLVGKITGRAISDSLNVQDEVTGEITTTIIPETLTITDSIVAKITGVAINDELDVADTVVARIVAVALTEELGVTDTVSAKITGRPVSDSVSVEDEITSRVSRSLSESLVLDDEITKSVNKLVSDEVEVADKIEKSIARTIDDEIAIEDDISTNVNRLLTETLHISDVATPNSNLVADDDITIEDVISIAVTRDIDDSVGVTDEAAAKVTERTVSDDLEVTDTITATVSRLAEETIGLDDAISTKVTRSIADELEVTDDADTTSDRPLDESLDIDDSVTASVTRPAEDELQVTDDISVTVSKDRSDILDVDDSISIRVTRSIDDELEVTDDMNGFTERTPEDTLDIDDSISTRVTRSIEEELEVTDEIAMSVTRLVSDEIEVTAEVEARTGVEAEDAVHVDDEITKTVVKGLEDSLQVTDEISAKITGVAISDSIDVSEEIANPGIPLSETLAITDTMTIGITYLREIIDEIVVEDSIFQPPTPRESIAITDSISIGLFRIIDDSVGIADEARRGWFVPIVDSLQVVALLTEVSWVRTLGFDEPLALSAGICVPSECVENMGYPEGLGLSDSLELTLTPPPELEETLTVTDQITLGLKVSAVPPLEEELDIGDSVTAQIIGILVVENKASIGTLPSTTVTGNYTYTGNAGDLKNSVIPIPIPINGTVIKPNLPGQITILRTYSVPIVWTNDIPTDNVIMSESQLEVPAYSNMFMRLNFNETPALSGHSNFMSMLDIEFTPKVDATDFGLVVSVTDLPAYAPEPTDELKPIYLDVRWWGDFPGAEDPSVQDYYENPPTFTFTVNDDWAEEQSAERDSNGVPELKLWLLNDATSEWEQITDIDAPTSGVDGQYTFTATLPHFSNYAITANVGTGGTGGGGGGGGGGAPESFAVQLLDGIDMHEGTQMSAITIIEEYLQPKKVSVFISDLVSVASKPVALPTEIKVDQEVTVKIGLDEVKEANLTDPGAVVDAFTTPSALAEIVVQITNDGEEDRQFEFTFTYNDENGDLHSQSVVLDVAGDSTVTRRVELPFTEPGTYVITVEVRNLPGGDLAGFSTLTIVIPWLKLYLYTIYAVAGAVLGISGIAVAIYLLARPEIPLAAGAAGTGLAVAAYKKRPKVRLFAKDEEEFKKDHKYQVLARLELRKVVHSGSQLKAMFALDIWSKRDGMEFVVTYRAVNALGVVVHESHILVPAVPDLQSLSVVMPFASTGHYTIQAEARREIDGDVLDKATLPVKIELQ